MDRPDVSCSTLEIAKNVRFQHYNPYRTYTVMFYAKNIIPGGNVDAYLIDPFTNKYDKIICIAILEHVYDPFRAVSNLKMMLKNGGKIFGYVPYLYHYHAPQDLKFQDYFRFSKDALAYLFKDFSEVELYPIRGRISSSFHMMFAGRWKNYMEKTNINILLDKLSSNEKNLKQCSGFNFILKK